MSEGLADGFGGVGSAGGGTGVDAGWKIAATILRLALTLRRARAPAMRERSAL